MQNVTRVEAPQSFVNEATAWTQELSEKREEDKDSDHYYDRYNHQTKRNVRSDMEDSLLTMYSEMCCYCETQTSKERGQIEHLRPKKKFPDRTYDWNNLHWVCSVCNGSKHQKYDCENPILDPSEPEPINHHIELQIDDGLPWVWLFNKNNSPRGNTTIEHADLNRDDLKAARMGTYLRTLRLISAIRKSNTGTQESKVNKNMLKRLYEGERGYVTSVKEAFEITGMTFDEL